MALGEQIKKAVATVSGLGRPRRQELQKLVKPRAARRYRFEDDGQTPNSPRLPLVIYRGAVQWRRGHDPAAIYEVLLGQEQGPRFGSFVAIFGIAETRALIETALKGELIKAA